MKKIKLGDSETQLLRYVAQNPSCTVREACDHFAQTHGWARTTVLKTFDRLRQKEMLDREEVEGVFRYSSTMSETELQHALVHQFLGVNMGGSLRTFVSYLHTVPDLASDDVAELRKLVERLEREQK